MRLLHELHKTSTINFELWTFIYLFIYFVKKNGRSFKKVFAILWWHQRWFASFDFFYGKMTNFQIAVRGHLLMTYVKVDDFTIPLHTTYGHKPQNWGYLLSYCGSQPSGFRSNPFTPSGHWCPLSLNACNPYNISYFVLTSIYIEKA